MLKLIATCRLHFQKKLMISLIVLLSFSIVNAQTYPEPEFMNEVYALKKDGGPSLMRLEKNAARQEAKTKMGGFGGMEYGYAIEGKKSPVRLPAGVSSFVFSTGASSSGKSDSLLRANGMENMPAMMGMDPANAISLYKTTSDKANRKVNLVQNSGAFGNKTKSSDKYTISIRQIKDGYWELVVDKPLPPAEYAFVVQTYTADGYHTLFAFGVD
jgi:hypothetical protein